MIWPMTSLTPSPNTLKPTNLVLTSGPLHCQFPLPRILSPDIQLGSPASYLYSSVTFAVSSLPRPGLKCQHPRTPSLPLSLFCFVFPRSPHHQPDMVPGLLSLTL